jgi:hypothetical protein
VLNHVIGHGVVDSTPIPVALRQAPRGGQVILGRPCDGLESRPEHRMTGVVQGVVKVKKPNGRHASVGPNQRARALSAQNLQQHGVRYAAVGNVHMLYAAARSIEGRSNFGQHAAAQRAIGKQGVNLLRR